MLHHQVQDGGLPRAVGPHDGDAAPAVHADLHLVQEPGLLGVVAEGHLRDVQAQGPIHAMALELELHHVVLHLLHEPVESVDAELVLHQGLGLLLGLALLLQGLQLVLLLLVFFVQGGPLLSVHLLKGRVVPSVVHQLSVLQVHDVSADAVEEVRVVGHHDHRMRVLLREVVVQPQDSVQIQVVRGLVQDDDVGLHQHQRRKGDPRFLAS
mmetsp:Transcript_89488/g.213850  ORF Transcript_89488/g.213850 Transcript_89488/m.213850 type:complete len:210 (-) Transcript_89488:775-1404(-)